ncbi:MAG: hypothetical protein M1608_13265, partial [Candidatus Omnitrophica bacterium]|nr:hypothetical protein [Candidatus Omnitrophota bacterium]
WPNQLRNICEKIGCPPEYFLGGYESQNGRSDTQAPLKVLEREEEQYSAPQDQVPSDAEYPTAESCRLYLEVLLSRIRNDPAKIGWVMTQLRKYLPQDFFGD